MGKEHISYLLMENMFTCCSEHEQVVKSFFLDNNLADDLISTAYRMAIERKMPHVAIPLLHKPIIKNQFGFMQAKAQAMVDHGNVLDLSLPYIDFSVKDFDEVVALFTQDGACKSWRKRMGMSIELYGTKAINNLLVLKRLYGNISHLDKILAYDHTSEIPFALYNDLCNAKTPPSFDWLMINYCQRRVFEILKTYSEEDFKDSMRIVELLAQEHGPEYLRMIREALGQKPKSIAEIHQRLIIQAAQVEESKFRNVMLDQEVMHLDGKMLLDFQIEVPTTGSDLIRTGLLLKNCMAGYIEIVQ